MSYNQYGAVGQGCPDASDKYCISGVDRNRCGGNGAFGDLLFS